LSSKELGDPHERWTATTSRCFGEKDEFGTPETIRTSVTSLPVAAGVVFDRQGRKAELSFDRTLKFETAAADFVAANTLKCNLRSDQLRFEADLER